METTRVNASAEVVTSMPLASAASTMRRPTNIVPPTISILTPAILAVVGRYSANAASALAVLMYSS